MFLHKISLYLTQGTVRTTGGGSTLLNWSDFLLQKLHSYGEALNLRGTMACLASLIPLLMVRAAKEFYSYCHKCIISLVKSIHFVIFQQNLLFELDPNGVYYISCPTSCNHCIPCLMCFNVIYHIVGKFGEFGESSVIHQTKTIQINTYD